MSKRESMLALVVVAVVGGWGLLTWVIDPALAAYDEVKAETAQLEQELKDARWHIDRETKYRQAWSGYKKAGLSRTAEEADAQTGAALFTWAEDAGFEKINLSDGRPREDEELPFAELSYTLQTSGGLKQVCDLLWSIRQSPFPLKIEKCVIDLRNSESQELQLSLSVSTLYTPGGQNDE